MKLGYKFNAVNIIRIGLIVFALIRIATFIFYKGGYSPTDIAEKTAAEDEAKKKEDENNEKRWEKLSEKEKQDEKKKKNEERKEENKLLKKCSMDNYVNLAEYAKTVTIDDIMKALPTIIQPSLWPTTTLLVPYVAIVVLLFMKKDISPTLILVNVTSILLLIYAGISCFFFSWRCRKVLYMVLFEIALVVEIALNCAIIVLEVLRGKKDGGTKTSVPTVASTMAPATAPATAPPTAPAVPATASAMAPANANGGPAIAPAAPPV